MTEFKQIIGRGTRLVWDRDKRFFTIMDFRKATLLFSDPAFDGPASSIYEGDGEKPVPPETGEEPDDDNDGGEGDDDETPDHQEIGIGRNILLNKCPKPSANDRHGDFIILHLRTRCIPAISTMGVHMTVG